MSRYIDADALLNDFKTYLFNLADEQESISKSARLSSIKWWIDHVKEMPTAEVVEVVRCKECKYLCHYTDGHLECRLLEDLKPIPTTYCTMNADDFCSYGERREDE